MSGRSRYVYRLAIAYPEGVDWRNPPDNWEERYVGPEDGDTFFWPKERAYLSEKAAQGRASLLRSYGCTVIVERSDPITWRAVTGEAT